MPSANTNTALVIGAIALVGVTLTTGVGIWYYMDMQSRQQKRRKNTAYLVALRKKRQNQDDAESGNADMWHM